MEKKAVSSKGSHLNQEFRKDLWRNSDENGESDVFPQWAWTAVFIVPDLHI